MYCRRLLAYVVLVGLLSLPVPAHTAAAMTTPRTLATTPDPLLATGAPVLRVDVAVAGMQHIDGAMLRSLTTDPARLRLWHHHQQVPIELHGTADGTLDAGDWLRFYAPTAGDRWNKQTSYWLTVGDEPPRTITTTTAASSTAPPSGYETGNWSQPQHYDSTQAGDDGDHWYSADLRTAPGLPTASITVTPALRLAGRAGIATYTLHGSAFTFGPHTVTVAQGTAHQQITWQGSGTWQQQVQLPVDGTPAPITITVAPTSDSGILLDRVTWAYPVTLATPASGATWQQDSPATLASLPPAHALYDVSDPTAPRRIVPAAAPAPLELTAANPPAHYLLTGSDTLHKPTVLPYAPASYTAALPANVLYIAPQAMHAALAPLVTHRQQQGYRAAVLDVQAAYDHWSNGMVSPEAIRALLRYVNTEHDTPLLAVTLVGDGTYDPHDYSGRGNPNWLPPYMADVDPWLGETACDTCYARLDTADPHDDPLPDVWLGRLPVKDAAELTTTVAKLIAYDTTPGDLAWRARALYLADNYYHPVTGAPDRAGDHATHADAARAEHPATFRTERLYYDPTAPATTTWRETNAVTARDRTLAALNRGHGLVVYSGHSHHWQWAITDTRTESAWLLGLYDTDNLTNGTRQPVVLSLTCLTSLFAYPAHSGTTIDERLLLHPEGGAIAVWGPTGLGVAHGHEWLHRGFVRELWQPQTTGAGRGTLGALVAAGYRALSEGTTCCQSSLYTFALLGDPLTQPHIATAERTYLPLVLRPPS